MTEVISREYVFEKLFNAFNYGNLGMFVGAGFSKAVVDDHIQKALGWFDLIKKVSWNFELDFPSEVDLIGKSLPELATNMCKLLASKKKLNYAEAKILFKK